MQSCPPMFTTTKQAESIVHTLSAPSKMPGFSYNTPAFRCKIGSLLRKVKGSICSKCYALKGRYVFQNVQDAMEKRFSSLTSPLWVEAITFLISKKEKSGFFRWHDSGDLQGTWHLEKIVQVAKNLPHISFWLPTREYSIVSDFLKKGHTIPSNLCVRLSALMIDGKTPDAIAKKLGVQVSGVSSSGGFNCPSSKQGNVCASCRACWDVNTYCVNYKQH
jgi:hypothetical protein